jgi:hypothetical protein
MHFYLVHTHTTWHVTSNNKFRCRTSITFVVDRFVRVTEEPINRALGITILETKSICYYLTFAIASFSAAILTVSRKAFFACACEKPMAVRSSNCSADGSTVEVSAVIGSSMPVL